MSLSVARANELAEAVPAAPDGHPFASAVHVFRAFLKLIPDSAPGEWTHEGLALVRLHADDVVETIETRINDGEFSRRDERRLVDAIYSIRRAVEEIGIWERHFLH